MCACVMGRKKKTLRRGGGADDRRSFLHRAAQCLCRVRCCYLLLYLSSSPFPSLPAIVAITSPIGVPCVRHRWCWRRRRRRRRMTVPTILLPGAVKVAPKIFGPFLCVTTRLHSPTHSSRRVRIAVAVPIHIIDLTPQSVYILFQCILAYYK